MTLKAFKEANKDLINDLTVVIQRPRKGDKKRPYDFNVVKKANLRQYQQNGWDIAGRGKKAPDQEAEE